MRFLSLLSALLVGVSVSFAHATELKTFGDQNAPATIYLFSSFTCPHCAHYHKDVLPLVKERFVDTGMAKLIFVDMAYDASAMGGALLSRCVPNDQYEPLLKVLYENQGTWAFGGKVKEKLTGYAKLLGMSETDVNRCLADKELQRKIIEQRNNLSRLYNVRGMPTTVLVKQGKPYSFVGADPDVVLSELDEALGK